MMIGFNQIWDDRRGKPANVTHPDVLICQCQTYVKTTCVEISAHVTAAPRFRTLMTGALVSDCTTTVILTTFIWTMRDGPSQPPSFRCTDRRRCSVVKHRTSTPYPVLIADNDFHFPSLPVSAPSSTDKSRSQTTDMTRSAVEMLASILSVKSPDAQYYRLFCMSCLSKIDARDRATNEFTGCISYSNFIKHDFIDSCFPSFRRVHYIYLLCLTFIQFYKTG